MPELTFAEIGRRRIHRRLPKISRRENTRDARLARSSGRTSFRLGDRAGRAGSACCRAARAGRRIRPAAPAEPAPPAPALTGLAGALAHFLEDDFTETDTGITEVAASGDPRAITIIEALQDGRLSYSAEQKKVFYKDKAGKLIDAVTGAPAAGAEPADLADVRLNNRVRRALDAALGGLSLQARDPAKRFESAQAVFKSREQSALPALDAALEKETDPRDQAGADRGARRRHPLFRRRLRGRQARPPSAWSAPAATRTR